MYTEFNIRSASSRREFTVKVGHGYRQVHCDVKDICYRCLCSGHYKKSKKSVPSNTCTHTLLTATTTATMMTTFLTCLWRQHQTCSRRPLNIFELLLFSLMFTTVMGIGNFFSLITLCCYCCRYIFLILFFFTGKT